MQTVFVCGGRGTRLRPGHHGPKTLLTVGGESLLSRLVRQCLPLHHSPEPPLVVVDGSDHETPCLLPALLPRARLVVQPTPDGVARALLLTRPFLAGPVLVVLGDVFLDGPVPPPPETPAIYVWRDAAPADVRSNFGVSMTEDDHVSAVEEKPADGSRWSCGIGLYVVDARTLDAVARSAPHTSVAEYGITDALAVALAAGVKMRAVPFRGFYRNVNTAADVLAVEARLSCRAS